MNRLKEAFQKNQLPIAYTGVTIGVMVISFAIMFTGRFFLRSIGFVEAIPKIWQFISLAFLAVVIGAVVAASFSRIPLKPLRKIAEAADRLAAGDFSTRINLKMGGELQELNTSFNNMANELEQSQMLRSDFINNFSHEFKTPITSIRGFAKMMREHELTREETEEYLDIIIAESDRLIDLSANVLNLSKIESTTLLTNSGRFNLSEQMRRVIVLLENRWEEKNIFVNLDCSEIYIKGNEEMLRQVWINLIDNAIKFANRDSKINISILQSAGYTTVTIADRGEIIAPEILGRIFDKFYQGDTSHGTKGNGLGLAVAAKIVSLHKGSISVVRSDEEETSFEVKLSNNA